MKNIKKYLLLSLTIVFCASLNTFGMEPIGESNTSSESGIEIKDKQLLEAHIKRLQTLDNMIIAELKNENLSNEERKALVQLLNSVNETIIMANNMVLGFIPVNTNFIIEKTRTIIRRFNQR